jgi:hypothetical protein
MLGAKAAAARRGLRSKRLAPELQCGLGGNMPEVGVGLEHCQVMTKAKLRQEGIDHSNLNACSPAAVS